MIQQIIQQPYRYDQLFGTHNQNGPMYREIEFRPIGHHAFLEIHRIRFQADGGAVLDVYQKLFDDEYIKDEFERAHHILHGMDVRGIDPREGPTRLHPGPTR